jgi:hypothetical protein
VYNDLIKEARVKQVVEVVNYSFSLTTGEIKILAVNEKGETIFMQRPSK